MSSNKFKLNPDGTKKKPGRPPLRIKKEQIEKHGVIDIPKNEENVMEFIYDMPIIFKKIFNFLKLMEVKEIKIKFMADSVQLISLDHLEKNIINLNIDCSKTIHYYCKNQIVVILDSKNIERVLQKIDKSYNTITIISKKDSYQSEIMINFSNSDIDIDEIHIINLTGSNFIDETKYDFNNRDYESYPIKFQLPCKYFKKIINDISSFSNIFKIEKIKGIELQFPYDSDGRTIKVNNIFNNPNKIKLESNIKESDIFSVSTYIDYVKALSNSLISDNIKIYLHQEYDMVFKLFVDNTTFELTIYTQIINFN
jgi:hypothetical protein